MCGDAYKDTNNTARGIIRCRKQNGEICPFVYWCTKIDDWRPLRNTQDTCKLRTGKEIPINGHKVRFEKKGKLYIEYNNGVIVLNNPFDYTPTYVELIIKGDKVYIKKNKKI